MKQKNTEFWNIIKDILDKDVVQRLHSFKHHYGSTRFDHCISVSYYSYKICKFLHLDYVSVTRAGMLHDLFLYDCENPNTCPKYHIWNHPKVALSNAEKIISLNAKEKDIILNHMWPITFSPPRYWETFVITCVDKYCSFKEWSTYSKFVMWSWYFNWFYT